MAGYKRYRRKRYYKRKPVTKGGRTKKLVTGQKQPTLLEKIASGVGGVASVAKAVLPMIQMINTEAKYIDTVTNAAIPIGTPWIQCLNLLAQGVDEFERIGNSILAKDLNIRVSFIPNYNIIDYNLIRFIIFVDKHQQGTAPTAAQLLTSPGNIDSAFNRDFTDRFVIIKDKRCVVSKQGDQMQIFHKVYKQLNFHCRYILPGGAAADLGNNAIYFFAISNAVLLANSPQAYIYSRINFTDN